MICKQCKYMEDKYVRAAIIITDQEAEIEKLKEQYTGLAKIHTEKLFAYDSLLLQFHQELNNKQSEKPKENL